MPTVSASAVVQAGTEEVFDFIADYRNLPMLQPQFSSAVPVGEVERGLGAVVKLEGRFHGMPMRITNRIITFTPPLRLVSVSEGTVKSRSTWELRPVREAGMEAACVTLTIDYSMRESVGGLFAGMGSVLGPLFHREVQGMTEESLRRLASAFRGRASKDTPTADI